MDWFPIVAVTFKVLVLGIGMFFAVKWHFDQGQKEKAMDKRAVMRAAAKVAAIFVLALLGVGLFAFYLVKTFGLDLS